MKYKPYSLLRIILASFALLSAVLFGQPVNALVPFGGLIVESFFCACSDTWLISFEPGYMAASPTLVVLTFTEGTAEVFLNRRIDPPIAGTWLLGWFAEDPLMCWVPGEPCEPIPSQGMIVETGTS